MTARLQTVGKLDKIIDFAIEGHANRPVLIEKRLVAQRREIDDRQPPMPQRNTGRNKESAIIGTTVLERVGHALEQLSIDWLRASRIQYASDATHSSPQGYVRGWPSRPIDRRVR